MIKKIVWATYWFGLFSPFFAVFSLICIIINISNSNFVLAICILSSASTIGYAFRMIYNIRPRPEPKSTTGRLVTNNCALFFIWLFVAMLEFAKAF